MAKYPPVSYACRIHDDDGYVFIMGFIEDVINTAGHRLSTGTMKEILMNHPEVADCADSKQDASKGEVPVGFVIANKGSAPWMWSSSRPNWYRVSGRPLGSRGQFFKLV
jgi:acyl-coenzyme A synthetase/AMP-(fatty) acid ligase